VFCKEILSLQGEAVTTAEVVQKYSTDRLYERIDGKSLKQASDVSFVHGWVRDGTRLMTGQVFCEALKVRINALPSRARTGRGKPQPRNCKAGCEWPETNVHVLQNCFRTHHVRIERHNRIAHRLEGWLKTKGFEVLWEPHIKSADGILLKPDLLVLQEINGERKATVVDVQVVGVYDCLNTLHYNKIKKYDLPWVKAKLAEDHQVKVIDFTTVTITYNGIFSKRSAKDLVKYFKITQQILKLLAVCAVEGSVYTWHKFRKDTKWSWKRQPLRLGGSRRTAAIPAPQGPA